MTCVYDFAAKTLGGEEKSLADFRGQLLLIVNTASRCGFTPQYEGLEQLYDEFGGRGFSVLGFPCNQFGRQEPGNTEEIAEFCRSNYGVSFPMFAKIDVNGPGAHPLYRYLKHAKRGIFGTERIKWNFTKFLVNRQGAAIARYPSRRSPQSLRESIAPLL